MSGAMTWAALSWEQAESIRRALAAKPGGRCGDFAAFLGWSYSTTYHRMQMFEAGAFPAEPPIVLERSADDGVHFFTCPCGSECIADARARVMLCSNCRAERVERLTAERRAA